MFLMIDNYDSFVYNLVHYFEELGETVKVYRNDAITIDFIKVLKPKGIILSPGPKDPTDTGICEDIIREFASTIPILGVCLGHQAIGHVYGSNIIKAPRPMHGKISSVTHNNIGVFKDIATPFNVTRYHSLVIDEATLSKDFIITSRSEDGIIMGIKHRELLLEGVQFHPEAVLTQYGHDLIKNYINWCVHEHSNKQLAIHMEQLTTDKNGMDLYYTLAVDDAIFLDSSKKDSTYSNYSIIGLNPFLTLKSHNQKLYTKTSDQTDFEPIHEDDIFSLLNHILHTYEMENPTDLPFIGGGLGYLSYDLSRQLEKLPDKASTLIDIPECSFVFFDNYLILDHRAQRVTITGLNQLKSGKKSVRSIKEKLKSNSHIYAPSNRQNQESKSLNFQSPFTRESYMKAVTKMIDYIEQGHIYIANMTHTYTCDYNSSPLSTYNRLRIINPAPFSAYMPFDDFHILSSSPERFIEIRNQKVHTRPIKGTMPRGQDETSDLANKNALLASEKDKSELLMIVDLERNDLSKVCIPGTVQVEELFKLEQYATVFHLVSTITGELKPEYTCVDCLKATFPGGSITGAPKVRAMEIIDELEPTKRNLYTGSIGYLGFDGNADFNIVIRTILLKNDKAHIGVGGGITWESNPESEYNETLDKAKALFRTLNGGN